MAGTSIRPGEAANRSLLGKSRGSATGMVPCSRASSTPTTILALQVAVLTRQPPRQQPKRHPRPLHRLTSQLRSLACLPQPLSPQHLQPRRLPLRTPIPIVRRPAVVRFLASAMSLRSRSAESRTAWPRTASKCRYSMTALLVSFQMLAATPSGSRLPRTTPALVHTKAPLLQPAKGAIRSLVAAIANGGVEAIDSRQRSTISLNTFLLFISPATWPFLFVFDGFSFPWGVRRCTSLYCGCFFKRGIARVRVNCLGTINRGQGLPGVV